MAYIRNARTLLADSKAGKNPFDGFTPSVSEHVLYISYVVCGFLGYLLAIYSG